MEHMSRRNFLGFSGGLLAGTGFLFGAPGSARAAEPDRWPVTVRDSHLRDVGEKDAWSALRAIGAEGAEVVVEPDFSCPNLFGAAQPYSIATDDAMKRLRDDAAARDLRLTALCMANKFDAAPDEEVRLTERVARAAQALGIPAIRLDVVPRKIKDPEAFLKFAIAACKRVIDATAETGVRFGIENHGGTTNRVDFLERLFAGVGSDRLGLTLDTGNFYWFGYPLAQLYDVYTKFAPRAFHTHVKSIHYPDDKQNIQREVGWEYGKYNCPITEGDIDFKRVVAILRKANYAGDLCIENESLGKLDTPAQRAATLAKEIVFLKELRAR